MSNNYRLYYKDFIPGGFMNNDYCLYYKAWHKKIKGHPFLVHSLLEANWKRQMTIDEGLLFIRLMIRMQNRRRRGHV